MKMLENPLAGLFRRSWLQAGALSLAGLWALYAVISLVLAFRASPLPQGPVPAEKPAAAQEVTAVDIDRMAGWALFGSGGERSTSGTVSAPALSADEAAASQTRLDLQLEGVMLGSGAETGWAVIAYQQSQDSYHTGDPLPVGSHVVLRRILADRVLIENSGHLEYLLLYDETKPVTDGIDTGEPGSPGPRPQNFPRPQDAAADNFSAQTIRPVSMLGTSNSERLASLTSAVRIAPVQDSQQHVLGYRIMPAANQNLFLRMGLRQGDLLTRLNGIDIGTVDSVFQVYQLLNASDFADITIQRNGREEVLRVDLKG